MIKDRVIKSEKIKWRELEWFQPEGFKEASDYDIENLEEIIKVHGVIRAFKVWDSPDGLKVLDGHLLYKVLQNIGDEVPDLLQAEFIECENEKQAAEFVLLYSSFWHKISEQGLYEFTQQFKINLSELNVNLPDVDMSLINLNPNEFDDTFSLPSGDKEPFQQMTFTLADEQAEQIKNAIADIKQTEEYKYVETMGNENSNGNALYLIIMQWEEQRR